MSDDIFKKLAEQVKENNERWEKIDEMYNGLKYLVDNGIVQSEDYNPSSLTMTIKLLLLLADQLRPMGNSSEQVTKLQDEIQDMLSSFTGGKK